MPERRLTGHLSNYSPDEVLPTVRFLADSLEDFEPTVTVGEDWLGKNIDQHGVPRLARISFKRGITTIDLVTPGLLVEQWVIDEYFSESIVYQRSNLVHVPTSLGDYGEFRWDETSRGSHKNLVIPLLVESKTAQINVFEPLTYAQFTLGDIRGKDMPELWENTPAKGFNHWGYGVKFLLETMKPFLGSLKHEPDLNEYAKHESFIHSLFTHY